MEQAELSGLRNDYPCASLGRSVTETAPELQPRSRKSLQANELERRNDLNRYLEEKLQKHLVSGTRTMHLIQTQEAQINHNLLYDMMNIVRLKISLRSNIRRTISTTTMKQRNIR